jgi:hypothetical protein
MIAVINNTRKKKKKPPHSNQILSSIIELLISANRVHRNLEKKKPKISSLSRQIEKRRNSREILKKKLVEL